MTSPHQDPRTYVVPVQDGQYYIEASGGRGGDWLDPQDGLTTGQSNWVAIFTGTQWGPVTLRLQSLPERSTDLETGWEMIVERDIVTADGGLAVVSTYSAGSGGMKLPPGRGRLRIHVRDRAVALRHSKLESPLETHFIQVWPSSEPQAPAVLLGPDDVASQISPN
ncbi:hypothetical protein [Actinomadura macra]|uniref:hypothetical protein n=1 Tax=Actinomadura macra TaxID=46164 RepID=UPI000A45219A|nr:hypothetical protein [Actinomadura macra]